MNTAAAALEPTLERIPLSKLHDHPANPRKHFNAEQLAELEASVRDKGVLVPLSVRKNGKGYEVLGGARRLRAAQAAGLKEVPALVRECDDATALELVVLDNLQRADLHPMEEAAGFHDLSRQPGYDVAKVAARVGRSVAYVYDRLKLLSLTKDAQSDFLAGQFTAGHAILLARLTPADQMRALKKDRHQTSGVYEPEDTLFGDTRDSYKARSVRELAEWIDDNVRFEPKRDADPMLFPETDAALTAAWEDNRKVIPVTYSFRVEQPPGERIYTEKQWKRADGKEKSKTCDHARLAYVAIGRHRGESFEVCTAREKCRKHWGKEILEREARVAERAKSAKPSKKKAVKVPQWQLDQQRERAALERYKPAIPKVRQAIAEAVAKMPVTVNGPIADVVIEACRRYGEKALDRGKDLESLLRAIALHQLNSELVGYNAPGQFPKRAKAFGVDVKAIVDAAQPVQPSAKAPGTSAKKSAGKKGRKPAPVEDDEAFE